MVAARSLGGANGFTFLQILMGTTASNWAETSYTILRTTLGDRTLWYNPVCTVKASKGTTILDQAPEVFKQYPFNTLTIVG